MDLLSLKGGCGGDDGRSEKDWASTPFGPLAEWPHTLKIALAVCLFSRFPFVRPPPDTLTRDQVPHHLLPVVKVIYWGPDYRMLYNDAYRPIMGVTKHPRYLGTSRRRCNPN